MTENRILSEIDKLANEYFHANLALHPEAATYAGTADSDPRTLSDYSPEGVAAQRDLLSSTLTKLAALEPTDSVDAVTKAAMNERLGLEIELIDAGDDSSAAIRNIASPIQELRDVFDLMPQETAEDWEIIGARLGNVAKGVEQFRESVAKRLADGPEYAARQIAIGIEQAEAAASKDSFFNRLIKDHPELSGQADAARAAFGELAEYLRNTVAPHGVESDGVGAERYQRFSREFLGATIDMDETYEWGKDQLAQIIAEQEKIATELYGPGVSVREAMDRLNADPSRQLHGLDALKEWMQAKADGAMEAVSAHFDIPDVIRTIECMVLPDGDGAIYYTNPTGDFSRPGRMWWSVPAGSDVFTTWQETTTVYHEGVPGHHLQLGLATYLTGRELNEWRSQGCWVSGHGEGWALYAEQLMNEFGFLDDPGDRMGMLDAQRLRAARVVVDLGVHLGKDASEWGKGTWNYDSAWTFLRENLASDDNFLRFELNRYLGWPGQAPAYKIGQRIWNDLREDARAKAAAAGEQFDLKAWHMSALSLGSVGLDTLREALQ